MPNLPTSQEQPAAPLTGAELVRITQAGSSRRTTATDVANTGTFTQAGAGAITRTAQAKMRDTVSTADYGTEAQAITAAGTRPILYADGSQRLTDTAWTPAQTIGITGSVRPKDYAAIKRTGGYGTYGLKLVEYLISAPSNGAGEFDVGITSWVTHQNLSNNNQLFGAWFGANTPSASLSQTYASGAAVGLEVNAGNRWADFGLLSDVGATRYTVGLQIVPDVLPASDGTTAAVYPGSFGLVLAPSIHGHKWWVGHFVRTDTIMPNGLALKINGGSTAPLATGSLIQANGFFARGLDFSAATISGQTMLFADNQSLNWGSTGISGTSTSIGISTGTGTGEGVLYGNNFAQTAFKWASSGSAPRLSFYGAATQLKQTVTGAKGGNAALTSLMTALSALGLVTDTTT